ncbi:hypothetical protein Slala04_52700 [Streptomyces lavendulae subsp. lavendulae]|nr:hypothetical protein Slala04_52700 [Streptomyces lavendulae subsp. lavendulae]
MDAVDRAEAVAAVDGADAVVVTDMGVLLEAVVSAVRTTLPRGPAGTQPPAFPRTGEPTTGGVRLTPSGRHRTRRYWAAWTSLISERAWASSSAPAAHGCARRTWA